MSYFKERQNNNSYKIFDTIAPTYSFVNTLLSFGLDRWWRRKLLKSIHKGGQALDIACGTGDLSILLAHHPKVDHIIGIDLSEKMVKIGRKKKAQNLQFEIGNGQNLTYSDQSFDLTTIAFGVRNFGDIELSLNEIYRTLKTGGRLLILEFSIPSNILVRTIYLFYFRHILPLVGGILARNLKAYRYLNQTVEHFPSGNDFINLLTTAGFKETTLQSLTFGVVTLYKGDKIES